MSRCGCWLLFLLTATALHAATTLRIASFNLQNYTSESRMVDDRYRLDYPKPETEKAAARAIIRTVAPDILCVQEMGPEPYLREFQRDLATEGLDYPYTALMVGPDPARHTAVLSRVPFTKVMPLDDLEFSYFEERRTITRGLLEVTFETEGVRWTLFNVHLHSRYTERTDDPESALFREREARAARDYIKDHFADDTLYLIAGDFNATRESPILRRFLQVGEREMSVAVDGADSRGERWTYHYAKADSYDRIDYLLASPQLLPRIRDGHGFLYDGPESPTASDHRLLWVDLTLGE